MVTVTQYACRREFDGRTLLIGTPTKPIVWLAQPNYLAPHYALCFDRLDAILCVDAESPLSSVTRLSSEIIRTHPSYRKHRIQIIRQRVKAA